VSSQLKRTPVVGLSRLPVSKVFVFSNFSLGSRGSDRFLPASTGFCSSHELLLMIPIADSVAEKRNSRQQRPLCFLRHIYKYSDRRTFWSIALPSWMLLIGNLLSTPTMMSRTNSQPKMRNAQASQLSVVFNIPTEFCVLSDLAFKAPFRINYMNNPKQNLWILLRLIRQSGMSE